MPPKKAAGAGGSTKAANKEKAKLIEDKTFGLKNKNKSAKVKQHVAQVQQQVMTAGNRKAQLEKEKAKQDIEAKKAAELKKKEELAELFKPIQGAQKIPFGTDPKTVLCQYFKAGNCEKGTKCKFSHDLTVERKTAKKDLYTDSRDDEQEDTMDNWDQTKLEEVVLNKHGNPRTTTDIVCKFFLDAIENQKYGWFWECPNGGTECKYRHALPPGFVLKSSKKKDDDKEEISIEDFLEVERHKLGTKLTPVNLETFTEWKKSRQEKYDADEVAKRKALESRWKSGKSTGMSGKNLFEFNPDWANEEAEDFEDGDDVFDLSNYKQDEDGETEEEFKKRMENMSMQDSVENGDEGYEEMDNGEGSSVAVYQEELFAEENLDDLDEDEDDDDDDEDD